MVLSLNWDGRVGRRQVFKLIIKLKNKIVTICNQTFRKLFFIKRRLKKDF